MDESTKLSAKQLLKLLGQLGAAQNRASGDVAAVLKEQLTQSQAQAAQQLLSDPQKLRQLLEQPQLQALLQMLQKGTDPDGTDA